MPLTLEPPTPNEEESPFRARQRFHKAFTLVTKELRERVKHFREPGTPSPVGSFYPPAESGNGGELFVVSVQGAGEAAPPQGEAARNDAWQEQEPGDLISTTPRSESPLVCEAVVDPSMGQEIAPEEPEVIAQLLVEADIKSPPWLKPLRLVNCHVHSVFGGELTNGPDSRASSRADVVHSFSNHRKYPSKFPSSTITLCHGHNLRYRPRPRLKRRPRDGPQLRYPVSSLAVGPSRPVERDLGCQEGQHGLSQQR